MIERLLAADAALDRGELEHAERLYAQVAEADARNAIAVVGLARAALARGARGEARGLLERALAIDPQEAAARRLLGELDATPEGTGPAGRAVPDAPAEPAASSRRPGGWFARLRRFLRLG